MTTSTFEPISSALAAFPSVLPALIVLLKITCVLLLALGATLLMPRASAISRHLIWLVAVAALLLLPPLAVWSPLPLRVLPQQLATTPVSIVQPGARLDLSDQQADRSVTPVTDQRSTHGSAATPYASSIGLGPMLLIIWAAVALVLTARLLYGVWSVRRIVREARVLEHPDWQTPLYQIADRLGLDGAPTLLQSDEVKMPFAAGLLKSWIVLPAESENWTPERRSAVLIHELGHVRRRDLIGHTLSRIVCALYWFHPLVWTAARRLRAESERACDDLALVFGARPSEYAEHLLDIVTCVRDHNTPAIALAMAHRKEFEGRMLAVLNPELRRRGPNRLEAASLVGSLALMTLLVGAAAPVARPARPVAPAPTAPLADTRSDRIAVPEPTAAVRAHKPEQAAAPAATPAPSRSANPKVRGGMAVPAVITAAATGVPDDDRAALLAKALRTDPSAQVRRVAAWGLQRYAQSDVAEQALTAAVSNDADGEVREMAAWALANAHHSAAASAALIKAVRQDKDVEMRRTAAWSLGSIRDESSLEALTAALGDPDAEVRQRAAWAVGAMKPDAAPAGLVRGLSDSDRDVRETTAWALFAIRDSRTIPAIESAFAHETDSDVQQGLIRALGAMPGDASVDALQKLVTSSDPKIRQTAITALAGGGAGGPWPWPWPEPRPFP
ncbi:MAG: M56 family metallopeptidase [Gemmatimonadota bacterium]